MRGKPKIMNVVRNFCTLLYYKGKARYPHGQRAFFMLRLWL